MKDYLTVTTIFILSFVFYSCNPYPICEQSDNCFIIGENEKIKIPFILPLTSTNNLISQELQKSFEFAFQENELISKIAELLIIDNFDDPKKNNEILLSFLESPESPIIFNFLFSDIHPQENKYVHKSEKVLVSNETIKNNNFKINSYTPIKEAIFNQTISLLSDLTYTKKTFIFADYGNIEYNISDLCEQEHISCYQFDEINNGLIKEITDQKSNPIVLIAQKPEISEWLRNHTTIFENPIIIIDLSFSNPNDFSSLYNNLYWIGPDIWVANSFSEMPDEYSWISAETIISYEQFRNVFKALESQLSISQNGFRKFDPNLFFDQYMENITERGYKFHIYHLHDRQFIMLKEPAMD